MQQFIIFGYKKSYFCMEVRANTPARIDNKCVIIQVPDEPGGTFTRINDQIFEWCADNNVDAHLLGSWCDEKSFSAWRIRDDKQRILFTLKWAGKFE